MPSHRRRTGAAAFALAAALWAAAPPGEPPAVEACPTPREARARRGHSTAAVCRAGIGRALRGPARRLFGLPLDPNTADAATLASLPGIGAVRAAAIVRERARRPFDDLRDLARVPGLGARTLAGLAGLVAVDPAPAEPVRCRCRKGRGPPGGEEGHGPQPSPE